MFHAKKRGRGLTAYFRRNLGEAANFRLLLESSMRDAAAGLGIRIAIDDLGTGYSVPNDFTRPPGARLRVDDRRALQGRVRRGRRDERPARLPARARIPVRSGLAVRQADVRRRFRTVLRRGALRSGGAAGIDAGIHGVDGRYGCKPFFVGRAPF
ncbi:MAG TPA: hypothetical protein VMU33_00185 [Burkholderiaceae bacterium]|nr:hypothetical protein [Burkholderiaceae bacterium]